MKSVYRKHHPPAGSRPGTLMIPKDSPAPKIHVMEFTTDSLEERDVSDVNELSAVLDSPHRFWIDVQGLGDEPLLHKLAEIFSLHLLTLEDVANVPSRPKTEQHETYQLFVTRMAYFRDDSEDLFIEQVGVIWGANYVLTIQEQPGDVLDPIRWRLRNGEGRPIRVNGPDYQAYAIIDCIIDGFYPVLEGYAEWIEKLESEAVANPTTRTLGEINELRRELTLVRRAIWPQREAVSQLINDAGPFVTEKVQRFLRHTYEHCVQVTDVIEGYRELGSGLLSTYLSCVSNGTNEVMKVLTIMASIFIPLTFMAGIYGMNFEAMPELHVPWAYPALWCVMLLTAGSMIVYFYRRGWIGAPRR